MSGITETVNPVNENWSEIDGDVKKAASTLLAILELARLSWREKYPQGNALPQRMATTVVAMVASEVVCSLAKAGHVDDLGEEYITAFREGLRQGKDIRLMLSAAKDKGASPAAIDLSALAPDGTA